MSTLEQTGPGVSAFAGTGGQPWKTRLGAVAVAVLAALAVWVIVEILFGVDLRRPAARVGGVTEDINAMHVAFSAAVGALAGWGLLVVLERVTSRARRWWTVVAIVVLLVSLGGPSSGSGIAWSNRLSLALTHVVVAAVVIVLMNRSARRANTVAS